MAGHGRAGSASHQIVEPDSLEATAVYKLLIGSVVPRPIAWVSSVSPEGVLNLAPFSFFTIASCEPPMVSITFVRRGHLANQPPKDTLANIEASREFVVNIVPVELSGPMATSALRFDPGVDEFEQAGLTPKAADIVGAPRVAEAPISMECRVETTLRPGSETMVIGRVLRFHFREGLLQENGRIDVEALDPLARLAGNYTRIGEPFSVSVDTETLPPGPPEQAR
jgi:flavin reductase (DIM6/NTAB) family NADH-FMN oxidoreductase RutF